MILSNDPEDYYAVGWEEGRRDGIIEGYSEAVNDYEPRIAKFWAEMHTLNARIDYLETQLGQTYGE